MNYLPTYLTALLFLIIYTAQIFTSIGNTNKTTNLLFFVALILFTAILNFLFGDYKAGIALVIAISAWLLGTIIYTFWLKKEKLPQIIASCSSSAEPSCSSSEPACPEPSPCDCPAGADTMECIDLKL
jgi:uncharacterized membrane protein